MLDTLMSAIVPFVFICVIMWFFLIRPQQQKKKETLANIRRGDTIIASGGLIGKVTKLVDEAEIEIEIADSVRVRIVRDYVAEVRSKSEPVAEEN